MAEHSAQPGEQHNGVGPGARTLIEQRRKNRRIIDRTSYDELREWRDFGQRLARRLFTHPQVFMDGAAYRDALATALEARLRGRDEQQAQDPRLSKALASFDLRTEAIDKSTRECERLSQQLLDVKARLGNLEQWARLMHAEDARREHARVEQANALARRV